MLQWTWEWRYFSKILISVLLHVPRNGITGWYDSLFSIFWGTTILLHSNWTFLQSHHHTPVFQFLHILINTSDFLFSFALVRILTDMKWYLIVVLIFISLMINDIQHFFTCLYVICISFLKNSLVKSFSYF